MTELIHGIRESERAHEIVTGILAMIPKDILATNQPLAAEILRYGGYWNDRDTVRRTLQAINHPFYDETYEPTDSIPSVDFAADTWSAILYAHVQLGHVDSSPYIFQSMQHYNLLPRTADMSTVVSGVAKFNLEAGWELATKLASSLDISAYETLLEIALERGNKEIVEWAKRLVAYDPPSGTGSMTSEDEIPSPESFGMTSVLSLAMKTGAIPTRTSRAVGAIIADVAKTKGIETAILMVMDSSMEFSRKVYDKLYNIAFDNEEILCAMWIAGEMRQRGWMPRKYKDLKRLMWKTRKRTQA
jgi:pentatricopeptide repeat protein